MAIMLKSASSAKVHLLMYAPSLTWRMLHFNNLDFYALPTLPTKWVAPEWLKLQLGLFSGRLYFHADEYAHVCDMLNLLEGSNGNLIWKDDDRSDQDSRLSFVRDWLLLRRREQDFTHTPMGMLCQQRSLTPDFFSSSKRNVNTGNTGITEKHNTRATKAIFEESDGDLSMISEGDEEEQDMEIFET